VVSQDDGVGDKSGKQLLEFVYDEDTKNLLASHSEEFFQAAMI